MNRPQQRNEPNSSGIPAGGGTGLKHEHARDILGGGFTIDFFEVHAENYMGAGGPPHHLLRRIRAGYPLSIHGVGLSIGGEGPLDREHLARLKTLIGRYEPGLFSEHLAWSSHGDVFLNDLLPLPYDQATLDRVCEHVDQVQEALGTRMLLENPSTYVEFATSTMGEVEFLRAVAKRSGCGLLLDVNNVHVSAVNHGSDPFAFLAGIPMERVRQIHLAGHSRKGALLVDTHDAPVPDAVWALYAAARARCGPVATMIERDADIPPLPELLAELDLARGLARHSLRSREAA